MPRSARSHPALDPVARSQETGSLGERPDDPQQGIRGPVLEHRPALPPDHGLRTHAEKAFEGVLAQAEALADLPDLGGQQEAFVLPGSCHR